MTVVIAPNNTPFRRQFCIEMGRCTETKHSLPSLPAMSYSLPSRPAPPMRRQTYSASPPSSIRRPLRSSPLTGPSLNVTADGTISELSLAPQSMTSPKPSRISSTPDLPSLTFTPIKVPKRTSAPNAVPPFKSTLPSPPPSPSRRPKSRDSYLTMSPSRTTASLSSCLYGCQISADLPERIPIFTSRRFVAHGQSLRIHTQVFSLEHGQ
ncbi:hypothetical protein BDZ89DRAFT_443261 [Hymenopellis radicata]|nr:hypothetical protein BDZ89DRAFT_443261 [Hymenopellis radicata]